MTFMAAASSRTRLVKNLKPKSRSLGRLEVAPKPSRNNPPSKRDEDVSPEKPGSTSRLPKSNKANVPPRSPFSRDSIPHEGVAPLMDGAGRKTRRKSTDTLKDMPPIPTESSTLTLKHWAARAHTERTERRAAERRRPRPVVNPLGNEFNTSKLEATNGLPNQFTSPPL